MIRGGTEAILWCVVSEMVVTHWCTMVMVREWCVARVVGDGGDLQHVNE